MQCSTAEQAEDEWEFDVYDIVWCGVRGTDRKEGG